MNKSVGIEYVKKLEEEIENARKIRSLREQDGGDTSGIIFSEKLEIVRYKHDQVLNTR